MQPVKTFTGKKVNPTVGIIFLLSSLLLILPILGGSFVMAGPSELNFQGVLLDASGNGVTGTRAMTVKLYDAAIGGNLLYTEDLGNVAVNKGVYSFNFGANGIGNGLITETVATTDGATMTYQKIVSASNVITGTVSVVDGIYSWNQTSGSSNSDEFGVSYSTSLRRITVTYYNGAPAAGKILTVNYRSPGGGINGVFDGITQPWVEIAVAGVTQAARQKILSVPFAVVADKLTDAGAQTIITNLRGELASI